MGGRIFRLLFAMLAWLSLTATDCAFVAKSGSSHIDDDERNSGLIVVIREGRLVDAPVEGVDWRTATLSGVTGPDGEFRYRSGEQVSFAIGAIPLGEPVAGKPLVTPLDLVPQGTLDAPAVINIARLLQSLDAQPGDDRITIPAAVRAAAVASNPAVAATIRFLDYHDNSRFANSAAQLVATLTAEYPFTGVLVDAPQARAHLQRSLSSVGPAGVQH